MEEPIGGKIHFIQGQDRGRFPSCNSLFIDAGVKLVVDPGSAPEALVPLADQVEVVINTHYHVDHLRYNYLFQRAQVWVHRLDASGMSSLDGFAHALGIAEIYGPQGVERWKRQVLGEFNPQAKYTPFNFPESRFSIRPPNRTFEDGEVFDFGGVRVEVVHTPGHSAGHCCLYFPNQGVLFTTDIDLTPFGPWYGAGDSSIEAFIASIERIKGIDAEVYVTGHQVGAIRDGFQKRLDQFLEVIYQREQRIKKLLEQGFSPEQMAQRGVIYDPKFHIDPWIYMYELAMIRKHLERIERG